MSAENLLYQKGSPEAVYFGNPEKNKKKRDIELGTDRYLEGIYKELLALSTENKSKKNIIYKSARDDIEKILNQTSGYMGLGKMRYTTGMIRGGAHIGLRIAKEAGLKKYKDLEDLFLRVSPIGMQYADLRVTRSNPHIPDLDGNIKIHIPVIDTEFNDGISDKSTMALIAELADVIGSEHNFAAYLSLVLSITHSDNCAKEFAIVVGLKDTFLNPNKIRQSFKSKKEAYKRRFFGSGRALYNIYMVDQNNKKIYNALCKWKRIYKHDLGTDYPLPKPQKNKQKR